MADTQHVAQRWNELHARNKIPRLEIEICVSRLQKSRVIGVQSKVIFVRDKNPPAFGTVPYAPHRIARKKDKRQVDLI